MGPASGNGQPTGQSAGRPGGQHIGQTIGRLAAALLGVVFLVAAAAKAVDPAAFAEQIRFEGLDVLLPAPWVAWIAVVLEAGLGAALVLGLRRKTLLPVGALVLVFVLLTARTYLKFLSGELDEAAACGCFGNLVDRTPAQAFWQDLLLLVPPYLLAVALRPLRSLAGRWRRGLAVAVAAATGLFTWLAPSLPLDDVATRLAPGVEIEALCVGSEREGAERACLDLLVPELLEGEHLVTMAALEAGDTEAMVDALNRQAGGEASVWLLTTAPEDEIQGFFWTWGPRFEVREVPEPLMRPLYRELPRSFAVSSGTVTATWTGFAESAGSAGFDGSAGSDSSNDSDSSGMGLE